MNNGNMPQPNHDDRKRAIAALINFLREHGFCVKPKLIDGHTMQLIEMCS